MYPRFAGIGIPLIGILFFGVATVIFGQEQMEYNPLTREEARVIIHKGTERPFTGEYWDHTAAGTYVCRQCDTPLYRSEDKFDGHCGWPSFDDEIKGAVKRIPDVDGRRTEIICANCSGHLGHVFLGEGFTPKDTRHCVNSISMKFIPADDQAPTLRAIFASGCFWGTEYHLSKVDGVISTTVGYTGGHKANPTYKEACTGKTGHAEAVEVVYDPNRVSFEELARLYFETHDPTQLNRQGPDVGTQYRSAVFYLDDDQKRVVEKLIGLLKDKGYDVVTEVTAASTFYKAEDYHQDYYDIKGTLPYCHVYQKKF
jgi:peptide methionine sulfoxide reductase msrA/msrB